MIERLLIVVAICLAIIFVPYWIGRVIMNVWFDTKDTILSWAAGAIIIVILFTFLSVAIPYVINGTV